MSSTWIMGVGAAFCSGGALAHFFSESKRNEGLLALAGFSCVIAALFLERAPPM